ncbi:MAG: Ldh family oxidoreductase [Chlorobiaceae bacterium]|nr:Ldh family oxidoreductase [Chlorobiaceae bacterium]
MNLTDKRTGSHYKAEELLRWASQVLQAADMPLRDAFNTARLLVRSDQRGYYTHGLVRLPSYVDRLREGAVNPNPVITIARKSSSWVVDADGALGQVLAMRVIEAATPYLQSEPLLWVNVRRTGHLGALGIIALEAAEAGFICMMGQRTPPLLGLPGFGRCAIGNNPFAFAAPAGDNRPPFVFDMACSVAARGHILLASRQGNPIPDDWALATDGTPTTDAGKAVGGILRPAGGYKGMGLSMMIECMAAAFCADAGSTEEVGMEVHANGAGGRQSAFFLFLNPAVAGDREAFTSYMRHWIDYYVESGEEARIPGQRGDSMEVYSCHSGIAYSSQIESELHCFGLSFGIRMPLPLIC